MFIKFYTARATDTNYNVVDTDYKNFAIVYSCNNKLFFKTGKKTKFDFNLEYHFYKILCPPFNALDIQPHCGILSGSVSEILWILTRQQFPPKRLLHDIYKKIKSIGLDTRRLRKTTQKGCPAPGH